MIAFAGPALPMDDPRWMAVAQAQLDASILRDGVSLDQALLDVTRRLQELFGDVLAPGVADGLEWPLEGEHAAYVEQLVRLGLLVDDLP